MASGQRAQRTAPESMDQFVARRTLEQSQRGAAEAAGRQRWAASTRTNQNLCAPRTSDVVRLGSQQARYGALVAPPVGDLDGLRRKQAVFRNVTREISRENSWMAVPVLAPEVIVAGLAGAEWLAAELAAPVATAEAPLVLRQRWPYQRGGETPYTSAGREAHKAFSEKVNAKPGWDANQAAKGTNLRPDAAGPARGPTECSKRFQLELKPDTPSGRLAGPKAAERYRTRTGNPTRPVYYDPKDYM